jgi:hypothetical protein
MCSGVMASSIEEESVRLDPWSLPWEARIRVGNCKNFYEACKGRAPKGGRKWTLGT